VIGLKIILSSVVIGSVIQAVPDTDGWVLVERPQSHPYFEGFQEENDGWVVFSKEIENEKFHVSLPNDPIYRYFPGGIFLDASLDGDDLHFQMQLQGTEETELLFDKRIREIDAFSEALLMKVKKSNGGKTLDLFYRLNEKWVWERIISTSKFLCTFRTESSEMSGQTHRQFISSLEIF